MQTAVLITTCNRPEKLREVIGDVEREIPGAFLVVVDDGSEPQAVLDTRLDHILIRNARRFGRQGYWRTVAKGFDAVRRRTYGFFVMLPDDVRLKEGFMERATETWKGIQDKRKACLSLHSEGRERTANWTGFQPVRMGDVWLSQWSDLCFISDDRFLRLIPRLSPCMNTSTSSGVGGQISRRLYKRNWNMYHVADTLVTHGNHPSVMHADRRKH